MLCFNENLIIKYKIYLKLLIHLLLIFPNIKPNVIEKDNCPLNDIDCGKNYYQRPQQYQRLFLFSNAILQITPKIQVPLQLSDGVDSGFSIKLPIKVKFQSQLELMSDWIKQFLATKTKRLTKNFNSFSASLTQLLGLLNFRSNAGPNQSEQQSGESAPTTDTGLDAGDRPNSVGSNTSSSTGNYSERHISGGSSVHKNNYEDVLQNQYANDSRAQARNILFESIKISHSTLGKACLQRAICEVSQTPLIAPNTGLFGELVDMFLTINRLHESLNDFEDYFSAQTVGQKSFVKHSGIGYKNYSFVDECRVQYGTLCPFSLFNINHIIPLSV